MKDRPEMTGGVRFSCCLTALVLLSIGTLKAQEPDLGTEAQRAAGKALYDQKCSQCHGENGAGEGYGKPVFRPAPRDFSSGTFKFRTTESGELPSNEDIKRSIRQGMPYTGMPPWPSLSENDVTNLMYYIKTFAGDFSGPYGVVEEITIPNAPSYSEESAQRGREVFETNQCLDCHGNLGRGDGKSAPTLEDQWEVHIRPADLTKRWTFRNGQTREDIYRTFTTGLDGSPMPSYDIPEEDRWALVDYVYSLSDDDPNYATVAVAEATNSELGMSELDDLFAGARAARFPIVGQVIEPGRAFFAGVNSIEVKAVYNQNEIAFMVSWHDMTAETTGSNSPTMSVPIFSTAVDSTGRDSTAYSDAVALLWPTEMPAGVERPYFMFGDADNAMDIWFADLASNNAQVFLGKGSESITPQDGNVRVSSTYEDGKWSVIFKRDRLPEEGLRFEEDTFVPVTFSVWDGFNQERGNKRGVSSWYHVYLTPMEKESPVGPMLSSGLITLLLSLGVVMLVRMRHKNQSDA